MSIQRAEVGEGAIDDDGFMDERFLVWPRVYGWWGVENLDGDFGRTAAPILIFNLQ